MKEIITLATCADTYNFREVDPVELLFDDNGNTYFRRPSRFRIMLRRIWRKITGPFRSRVVVTEINHETGTITVASAPKWYRFL